MLPASPRFRIATSRDVDGILPLMAAYYAEDGYPFSEELAREQLARFIARPDLGVLWVAVVGESVAGYLAVTLGFSFEYGGRDAFIDELYIAEPFRGAGLGREALALAEAYCRSTGVRAIHLEVELHRTAAASLYEKLGFLETGRRLMTKRLAESATERRATTTHVYGRQLATIHHHHFTDLAREAAAHLVRWLDEAEGPGRAGTIVELACGGGVSSKILADAGYDVVGVDSSDFMLALARAQAPKVVFSQTSLWEYELPPALRAITAIGEAFCYHGSGCVPTHQALEARLHSIFAALSSGGVLLFDVATAGRSGPTGRRQAVWEKEGSFVLLDEVESETAGSLERVIDSFVLEGGMHRHEREVHRLTLFDADRVDATLAKIGFRYRKLTQVGHFTLLPGWVAFEAMKP